MGGEWETDDNDPQGEVNATLLLPGGDVVWLMQRVMKRLTGGGDEGIAGYAAVLGVSVGP